MRLRDRVFNAIDWLFWRLFSRTQRVIVIHDEAKKSIYRVWYEPDERPPPLDHMKRRDRHQDR